MTDAPALEPLDESAFETVLCVAAHPDDLEFQCAGTLALLSQQWKWPCDR